MTTTIPRIPMRIPLSQEKLTRLIEEIEPLKIGFDLLQDHVIITDENANILYANKAVEENTGYSVGEVIGKSPADLWGGRMADEFYEKMWHTIKVEKRPFVGEVHNVRKGGAEYWQELHISPVLDEGGNVKFFIGIEPNITDRKKREQFREEFASATSHQLQGPLAVVRWVLEWLLERGGLKQDQREKLEMLYESNQKLISLVGDLLFISRIGDTHRPKEAVDLAIEIGEIIKRAQERFPHLLFFFEKGLGAYSISTNKALATQVFTNIIFNAAEYSRKDSGKVVVTLVRDYNGIAFSSQDNGIGIPAEDQPKIFSRFFRASNAKQIKETGTGLGLFIAKMIADHFGWEISFQSKAGIGTTFFVKMPA